jgi:hypothetical protein
MNKLEKLAIRHIMEIAEQQDNDLISLGTTLSLNKDKFDPQIHTYPLAAKSRKICDWLEAILENQKIK